MSQAIEPTTNLDSETNGVGSAEISRTDIHDVLSNDRRIALLRQLSEDSPQELGQLAEAIAAAETGQSPPPRNKRQSVYVTLHQTHLPKLDDLDIVEYDARSKVVALSDHASLVCEDDETETTASSGGDLEPSLLLVVGGLLASLASAGGLEPFTTFSMATYALGTLVALLIGFAYRLGRDRPTAVVE